MRGEKKRDGVCCVCKNGMNGGRGGGSRGKGVEEWRKVKQWMERTEGMLVGFWTGREYQ